MESQHATKYISWHPADTVRSPRSADLDISIDEIAFVLSPRKPLSLASGRP